MRDFKYPKGFPNKEEELFLKLILSSQDDFPGLWEQREKLIDFERLKKAILKLIPLLYLRLKKLGISANKMGKIKGIYNFTWYRNQLVFNAVKNVVSLLNKENIPVILLKGVPLLKNVYQNTGARSVSDVDILIDPKYVEKGVEVIKANDWQYQDQSPFAIKRISEPLANKYIKEITFIDKQKIQVDLHWRLFMFVFKENREHPMSYEEVFNHSLDFEVQGVRCKIPCPEDMIIHIIVHGAEQVFERTLRWVLDVVSLIRTTPIDWEFLIERIKKFDVAVELNVAFSYLLKNYSIPVPESFIQELSKLPMKKEKIKDYYRKANHTEFMVCGKLSNLWRGYWLYERKGTTFTSWYYFIDYVCKSLGITKKRQMPAFIFEKYKQRIQSVLHN